MSETNAQGQSPLNEGTDREHEAPEAPTIDVDPDLNPARPPQEAEDDQDATQQDHDPMSDDDTASGGAPEE
ncbi:MAG: hypothetical protein ABI400_01360 [Lacisediminihabitans sp.]